MKLSAPTVLLFVISLVVAIFGLLAALNVLSAIPIASVWIMAIAYAILAVACMFKGA